MEKAICQFKNIIFCKAGHFFPFIGDGIFKGIADDPFTTRTGHDL